jgi:hypothetical protein
LHALRARRRHPRRRCGKQLGERSFDGVWIGDQHGAAVAGHLAVRFSGPEHEAVQMTPLDGERSARESEQLDTPQVGPTSRHDGLDCNQRAKGANCLGGAARVEGRPALDDLRLAADGAIFPAWCASGWWRTTTSYA